MYDKRYVISKLCLIVILYFLIESWVIAGSFSISYNLMLSIFYDFLNFVVGFTVLLALPVCIVFGIMKILLRRLRLLRNPAIDSGKEIKVVQQIHPSANDSVAKEVSKN